MSDTSKAIAIARRLARQPRLAAEVGRRVGSKIAASRHSRRLGEYDQLAVPVEDALSTLTAGPAILAEMGTTAFENLRQELAATPLTPGFHNRSGAAYLDLYYAVVRALRPESVLETGVALGYGSTAILQGLHENGSGRLISVDLPSFQEGAAEHQGAVVPARLKTASWDLRVGPDRQTIPTVLRDVATLDVVFYDSDKSYAGMMRTWREVWPRIRVGGLLVADDVQYNDAYLTFRGEVRARSTLVRKPSGQGPQAGLTEYFVGILEKIG